MPSLIVNRLALTSLVLMLCVSAVAACAPVAGRGQTSAEYDGTPLDGQAPDFRLADQSGEMVSLSDYRGRVVVLSFMDSHCREACPRTAAELLAVYRALGPDATSVGFLGVNVNAEATGVQDVASATMEWRLDEIPSWRFLTASAGELQPVWEAYGIGVIPSGDEGGELLHSTGIYLIDPSGEMRWYISTPMGATSASLELPPLQDLLLKHLKSLLTER